MTNTTSPVTHDRLSVLFDRYDRWQSRRQALSEAEASGDFPDPDDWHDSDDEAVDLLVALIDLLRKDHA